MYKRHGTSPYRLTLTSTVALLGIAMVGGVSAEPRSDIHDDRETCARFGTHYGSREHAKCMLIQQRRHDTRTLDALEQQRISAEIAQTNLATVRRMRCEREAEQDRKRGERPRWCR